MKVKVTIPDELLRAADSLRKITGQTRSSLVSLSLLQLLSRCGISVELEGPPVGPSSGVPLSPHLFSTSYSLKEEESGEDQGALLEGPRNSPSIATTPMGAGIHSKAPRSLPSSLLPRGVSDSAPKVPKRRRQALCSLSEGSFEAWWKLVPKKAAKGAARAAYAKALLRCGWSGATSDAKSHEKAAGVLAEGARRWSRNVQGIERRFVKNPSTWLNQDCWEDEDEDPYATIGTSVAIGPSDWSKRESRKRDIEKLSVLRERLEDGPLSPRDQSEYDRLSRRVRGEV